MNSVAVRLRALVAFLLQGPGGRPLVTHHRLHRDRAAGSEPAAFHDAGRVVEDWEGGAAHSPAPPPFAFPPERAEP